MEHDTRRTNGARRGRAAVALGLAIAAATPAVAGAAEAREPGVTIGAITLWARVAQ